MKLEELTNSLQELILDKKIMESKEYLKFTRKANLSFKRLECAIEKKSNLRVKKR